MTIYAAAPVLQNIPSVVNGIESYISAAYRIPMLTEEEERALATALKEHNDLEAARKLVLSHLRLVVSIARKYLGYGLPHADLIQEGNVGLMKAVKRFDVSRGVRLTSYAVHWINAEIQDYVVRSWRLVRIATTKAQRKLFFNLRGMKNPSESLTQAQAKDIAAQLGVKPAEVFEMEGRFAGGEIALERPEGDEDASNGYSPLDYLADPAVGVSEKIANSEIEHLQHTGLSKALASLDERSREIVMRRWLAEEGKAATLSDLSKQYGVSLERIRQIEVKAMKNLKAQLQHTTA